MRTTTSHAGSVLDQSHDSVNLYLHIAVETTCIVHVVVFGGRIELCGGCDGRMTDQHRG